MISAPRHMYDSEDFYHIKVSSLKLLQVLEGLADKSRQSVEDLLRESGEICQISLSLTIITS